MVVLNVVHTLFKLFCKRRPACCCDGTLACCAGWRATTPPRQRRAHRASDARTAQASVARHAQGQWNGPLGWL